MSRWNWGSGNPRWPARTGQHLWEWGGGRTLLLVPAEAPTQVCSTAQRVRTRRLPSAGERPPGRTQGSSPRAHGSPGSAVCVAQSAGPRALQDSGCRARRGPTPQGGDSSFGLNVFQPCLSELRERSERFTMAQSKTRRCFQGYRNTSLCAPPPPKKYFNV